MEGVYFIGNNNIPYDGILNATIDDAIEYLSKQSVIAVDLETGRKFPKGTYKENIYKPGLDPRLSRILMLQIGTLERRYVIDVRVVDIRPLLFILEDPAYLKVGANLIFESLHFRHNYGINIRNMYDVLLVDRIMTNGLYDSYSLEALMKRYRGYETKGYSDLFGTHDSQKEVQQIYEKLVENWIFLYGRITEEKEEELMQEAWAEVEDKYVDKSIRLEFVEWGDKPFRIEHIKYGDKDITEPLLLREIFLKGREVWNGEEMESYYPEVGIRMENKLIEVLCEMIHTGVCLDQVQWSELAKQKRTQYFEKIAFLNDYVIDNHPEFRGALDMFTNKPECMLSWASPKQVQKLFDKMGLSVEAKSKFTGKVEKTVGAKELIKNLSNEDKTRFADDQFPEKIENGQDLVVAYLLVKKLQQLYTTYGEQFLDYVHPITKRIHCNVRQYLNTSRMAATRPNMLAIPRGKEYRMCFVSPKKWKVWACDYTSQEVAVTAEVYNVETLQEFFIKKLEDTELDMHCYTADKIYKIFYKNPNWVTDKKKNKKERQNAKIATFLIIYQGSGKALGDMLGISADEGEQFISTYYDAFPGMREEIERHKKLAYKRGWIQIDPYTDKRYFYRDWEKMKKYNHDAMKHYPEDYRTYSPEKKAEFKLELYAEHPEVKTYWREWAVLKGKLERRAINFKVQGSAATQTKAALLYMWNTWDKNCFPVLSIHDEIMGYYNDESLVNNMKELMLKGARYICKKTPVFADMASGENYWIH